MQQQHIQQLTTESGQFQKYQLYFKSLVNGLTKAVRDEGAASLI